MDIKELEQILGLLKQNEVTDFELEREGTKLKLTRGVKQIVTATSAPRTLEVEPAISAAAGVIAQTAISEAAVSRPAAVSEKLVKIESPLVGTFYRKPSPDAQPFVQEGQVVKKGQTLCIVEAMKLMNEIESSCDGKVERVLVGDGEVVEYGEVLFLINPEV